MTWLLATDTVFTGARVFCLGRMLLQGVKLSLTNQQRNVSAICFKKQPVQSLAIIHHFVSAHQRNHYRPYHHQKYSSLQNSGINLAKITSTEKLNLPRLLHPPPCISSLCRSPLHTSSCNRNVSDGESNPGKLVGWWRHHQGELKSAPMAALVLGSSGLIPFVLPAVYSLATMSCGPNVAFAQVAYGACILSFLGGVRWGFALTPGESPGWLSLGYSVVPSLVAWMGLMMPIQPGLFCVMSGLAFAGVVDSRFKSYPSWFRSLRFFLTMFAILSISVTFIYSLVFPPPEPESGYNFRKLIKIAQIIVED